MQEVAGRRSGCYRPKRIPKGVDTVASHLLTSHFCGKQYDRQQILVRGGGGIVHVPGSLALPVRGGTGPQRGENQSGDQNTCGGSCGGIHRRDAGDVVQLNQQIATSIFLIDIGVSSKLESAHLCVT